MAKLNRKLVGLILLAALDFKEGNRKSAAKNLQLAAEDEDFEETLEGLNDVADEATDPFLTTAGEDDEGDGDDEFLDTDGDGDDDSDDGDDDGTGEIEGLEELLETSSIARAAKASKASKKRAVKAADEEPIGGNEGTVGADPANGSDEEIRQVADTVTETASTKRMKQVRANLQLLASAE